MMIEVDIGAMTSGRAGGRAVQIKYFFFFDGGAWRGTGWFHGPGRGSVDQIYI